MGVTFENAPLIELITEIRWGAGAKFPLIGSHQVSKEIGDIYTGTEEFFRRFADLIAPEGFSLIERLVPIGFPALPLQPVYRYRDAGQESGKTLLQLGTGVFSAHALPPYKSWDDFEPTISKGIKALLQAREDSDRQQSFGGMIVRYINAFSGDLRQNRSVESFVRDVLGIKIILPEPVARILSPEGEVKPRLQLLIPVRSGYQLSLNIGEGLVNGQLAILMDITTASTGETSPTERSLMAKLKELHDVVHDIFIEMTTALHDVMKLRTT
jgi:uncharacterized protein (TIGR04255 family)